MAGPLGNGAEGGPGGGEEGGGVPKGVQGGEGEVGVARAFGFADGLVFFCNTLEMNH